MHRAFCYRIYPSREQQKFIELTFNCARFAYNKMLEGRKAAHASCKDGQAEGRGVLPSALKKAHPWLKAADSLALANAQLQLDAAYRNFFEQRAAYPKFKKKNKERPSYTTNNVNGAIRLLGEKALRLPKLKAVKLKLHRPLPTGAAIKGATVSRDLKGDYYVALLLKLPDLDKASNNANNSLDTSSANPGSLLLEGRPGYPASCQKTAAKIQKAAQEIKRRHKGRRTQLKSKQRLAALHAKAARQKKDFLHKLSRRIANGWGAVAVEDNPAGKKDGLAQLKRLLAYKLEERGGRMVAVSRGDPPDRRGGRISKLSGVA